MSNDKLRKRLMKEQFVKVMKDGGKIVPHSYLPEGFSIGSDYSIWFSEKDKLKAIEDIINEAD